MVLAYDISPLLKIKSQNTRSKNHEPEVAVEMEGGGCRNEVSIMMVGTWLRRRDFDLDLLSLFTHFAIAADVVVSRTVERYRYRIIPAGVGGEYNRGRARLVIFLRHLHHIVFSRFVVENSQASGNLENKYDYT